MLTFLHSNRRGMRIRLRERRLTTQGAKHPPTLAAWKLQRPVSLVRQPLVHTVIMQHLADLGAVISIIRLPLRIHQEVLSRKLRVLMARRMIRSEALTAWVFQKCIHLDRGRRRWALVETRITALIAIE